MHLGPEIFVTSHRADLERYEQGKKTLQAGESVYIPAGQFAFLMTKEYLTIPIDVMAFASLRTRVKYRGLINVSGFHVDPGFRGKFLYAVYNAGPLPITLAEGDAIFLIWFAELDRKDSKKNRLNRDLQVTIDSGTIQQVSGQVLSLQELTKEIRRLDRQYFNIKAVAGVAATFGLLLFAALAVPWHDVLHWSHAWVAYYLNAHLPAK